MPRWTQNCGVRRLPLDFRDQYFGCEIELTGINRATAAQTLADLFGTRAEHSGGGYDAYRVKDLDGKEWKIVRDSSIHPECRRRSVLIGETYKVELNSPNLNTARWKSCRRLSAHCAVQGASQTTAAECTSMWMQASTRRRASKMCCPLCTQKRISCLQL